MLRAAECPTTADGTPEAIDHNSIEWARSKTRSTPGEYLSLGREEAEAAERIWAQDVQSAVVYRPAADVLECPLPPSRNKPQALT